MASLVPALAVRSKLIVVGVAPDAISLYLAPEAGVLQQRYGAGVSRQNRDHGLRDKARSLVSAHLWTECRA